MALPNFCHFCYSYLFIQVSDSLILLGFFVDINLFNANKETAAEISSNSVNETGSNSAGEDDFADEDANLMVKLKFLTYKVYIHFWNMKLDNN